MGASDSTKPADTSDSTKPAEAVKTSAATPTEEASGFHSDDSVLTDSDEEWSDDDHEKSINVGTPAAALAISEPDKKGEVAIQETPQLNSSAAAAADDGDSKKDDEKSQS